jgi:hypothetical protein
MVRNARIQTAALVLLSCACSSAVLAIPTYVAPSVGRADSQPANCATLPDSDTEWDSILSFRPSDSVQKIAAQDGWVFDELENGNGDLLNLDYYPVEISRFPSASGQQFGPGTFVEFVRTHFNFFLDPTFTSFTPTAGFEGKWAAGTEGAEVTFGIRFQTLPGQVSIPAYVFLAEKTADHWIFVTGHPPQAHDHPVSGSRKFGIEQIASDRWLFYTRGADRVTPTFVPQDPDVVFGGGDDIWSSFQDRLADFVKNNGGQASGQSQSSKRYCWSQVSPGHFHPSVNWNSPVQNRVKRTHPTSAKPLKWAY